MKNQAMFAMALAALVISPAAGAQVEKFPTGFFGVSPAVAVSADGVIHLVYAKGGGAGVGYAALSGGAWSAETVLPDSASASASIFDRPSIDTDPSSYPHVVWGSKGTWNGTECTHTPGEVFYWNGATNQVHQIFNEYIEYISIALNDSGEKMFGASVIQLPGEVICTRANTHFAAAPFSGDALGDFTRFDTGDLDDKLASFCTSQGSTFHLVASFNKVVHVQYAGASWSGIEKIGWPDGPVTIGAPACSADGAGTLHLAWLQWEQLGPGDYAMRGIRYAKKVGYDWLPSMEGLVVGALPDGGVSLPPTIALDPAGTILVAWLVESELYISVSFDGGESFTSPEAVLADAQGDTNPDQNPPPPVFFAEGHFQVIYKNDISRELIRGVFMDIEPPPPDQGPEGADEAVGDAEPRADAPVDGATDGRADGGTENGGGCSCRLGSS